MLARNEVVSRDRLIDGLWGERPPASVDHSLDHHASRLRRTLRDDRVVRRAPGYVLRVEPDELDLDRFEHLRRQGRAQLADLDVEAAVATLDSALELWRGAALADVLYEPFAATRRGISRSCGYWRSRTASRANSRSVAAATSCPSSSAWSPSIRCASGCSGT